MKRKAGTHKQVDVIVVGSGAGGAPVALRLVEAGLDVLVVEEGGDYKAADFNQRERDMIGMLYRDAGSQSTNTNSCRVLQGACVGGSTVINMGDVVPMDAAVIEHWQKHHRFELADFNLEPYLQRALGMIDAGPIPPHLINRNAQLLQHAAQQTGQTGHVFYDNREGCVGSGYCLIGCAYDAKKSMITNYLPTARAQGLQLLPHTRAQKILFKNGHARGVRVLDKSTGKSQDIYAAKGVVIACGAIHTPLLLKRSGIQHPALGRQLSLQPQNMVLAEFAEPVNGHRGIPQSVAVEDHLRINAEEGLAGYALESIMVGPAQLAAGFGPPGLGPQLAAAMQRYTHMAGCFVLAPDRPEGRVREHGNNVADIDYTFSDSVRKTLWEGICNAAEMYLEIGAQKVHVVQAGQPPVTTKQGIKRLRQEQFVPIYAPTISAHPQGTARLGGDPAHCVVDPEFAVRDVQDLYVIDASIFPTSASTHTMVPILTMAELASDVLIQTWRAAE